MKDRNISIIRSLSLGVTVKQIASDLALSPRTVEAVIQNLMHAYDCQNTYHLIGTFFRKKIIE